MKTFKSSGLGGSKRALGIVAFVGFVRAVAVGAE